MKFFISISLFFFSLYTLANTIITPTATITGNATVCQNDTNTFVTFTGFGGMAPYTFTYHINSGAAQTVVTTDTSNTITVQVDTSIPGTMTYYLDSVSDATLPTNEISQTGSVIIIVNPQPDASIGSSDSGSVFGGIPVFRQCNNTPSVFNFSNNSTTIATNTSYSITWGDGSPIYNTTSWSTLSHTYQVGLWFMAYTVTGSNGCSITQTFIVFVGSNPAISLGNPGNTNICNLNSITFPITGYTNNPPGTTYTVNFNDGSAPQVFNHPPPDSVDHTFLTSSCGTTSVSGGGSTYSNSFAAHIKASNPCGSSEVSVVPIYVSSAPHADFNGPTTSCINTVNCFTNASLGNQIIGGTCSGAKIIWSISPSTGFTITSGTLGNDFSSTDTTLWIPGSNNLCINFSTPGTYSIKLKIGNKCGIDEITKTICIEAPLVPTFTLTPSTGCTPFSVVATNTTSTINTCNSISNLWHVSYVNDYCGSSTTVSIPDQTSTDATYTFTESGTYTIQLTTTGLCGSVSTSQNFIVKKPPIITDITGINLTYCGNATINPLAVVNACTPDTTNLNYNWSFPGANITSSTAINPTNITYSTSGIYTITLMVSNECGASTSFTKTFTIYDIPNITTNPLSQTVCSGVFSTSTTLNTVPTGATFSWNAVSTSNVTGYIASGTTDTIPGQIFTNTSTTSGTVTYTIIATANGCVSNPTDYIITVNPVPSILSQPLPNSFCIGGSPNPLSIVLSSNAINPSFQWYSNTVNSTIGGTLITNATNDTFIPPALTVGTTYYYCVITFPISGCTTLYSNVVPVSIRALPSITTQPIPTQNICIGATTSSALSFTLSGGAGPISYQWYSNTTNSNSGGTPILGATHILYTPPIFNTTGTYYYYATANYNGNGCGSLTTNTTEIVVYPDPFVTSQPIATQTICLNSIAQNLELTAAGGNGSFSYQWYSNTSNNNTTGVPIPSATNASFTPPTNTIGTLYYYCIVSQSSTSGCSVTSNLSEVIIIQNPSIDNQPQPLSICQGGTPGSFNFTYTNGVGIPNYQWYTNSINSNIGGTPISGETNATYTPTINTLGIYYFYCMVTFPSVNGVCNTISTNPVSLTITEPANITSQPLAWQNLCVGTTLSVPLTITYSGGAGSPIYQWYSNTTNSYTGAIPVGSNSASYTPPVYTSNGSYFYFVSISLTGSGCGNVTSSIAQVDVIQDPIILSQPLANQNICLNSSANDLSVVASGGIGSTYNYQWYSNTINNTTSGTPIPLATNSTYTPPTNVPGIVYYYCVITQPSGNGCDVTSALSKVEIHLAPSINNQPQSSVYCSGDPFLALTVSYTNGFGTTQYQWFSNTLNSNSGGIPINGATSGSYTPSPSAIGTYYFYCTLSFPDLSGTCNVLTTQCATITVNQKPIVLPKNTLICSGSSFTITPSTGSGDIIPAGTTYTWGNPSIIPTGSVVGASSQSLPQLNIGQSLVNTTNTPATVVYTVIPASSDCIGNPFTITVVVNPMINPNAIKTDITCFGLNNGSISTSISGGIPFTTGAPYTISWVGPNGFNGTTPTINNLSPGQYILSINDAGGCPITTQYTIVEPADISITTDYINNVTCYGNDNGAIGITISGGVGNYTHTWTHNTFNYSSTEDLTNLGPGTYIVTVSDANNCGPKNASFTITEPPQLLVSLVSKTDIDCFGAATGAITISATGGTVSNLYTFSWSGPNGFTSTSQNLTNLYAGIYHLTVTDDLGCEKNLSVTLIQNSAIVIQAVTTPITCYGDNNATISVTLSGGSAPYQIQWSNLATGLFLNNLNAGDYTLTVTDSKGCQKTSTITIQNPALFSLNPVVTNVTCFGAHNGSIALNYSGGTAPVNLIWSDGSTAGVVRNNLGPGSYSVVMTDANSCSISGSFTIIEPLVLSLNATITNALNCNIANSGAIDLIVSGGTPPFTYNWSNSSTTEDLNNIPAGTYIVQVTDSNGCTQKGTYVITRPNPLASTITTTTNVDCNSHSITQNFTASATGGMPPYQFSWSSGTVSGLHNEFMTTSQDGLVTMTTTDTNGCTSSSSTNVHIPTLGTPSFSMNSYGYSTFGIYTIIDPIQFSSNLPGDYVSIAWNFGDGTFSNETDPNHVYVNTGTYSITQTVTYPFGCVYVNHITLVVEKGYVLVLPTAFTPNVDGINDTFKPITKGLKNIRLDIYDTWGSLIYSEIGDTLIGWDGKIKNIKSENGNYYAKVSAETFYGTTINENQTFVLIK